MTAKPKPAKKAIGRPRKSAPTAGGSTAAMRDAMRVDPLGDAPRPLDVGETKADKDSAPIGRPTVQAKLEKQLGETLTAIGLAVMIVHPGDALVVIDNAPDLAAQLARLAATNERVRKLLTSTVSGSAYLGVVMVLSKMTLQIAANHGAQVPPVLAGIVPGAQTKQASASDNGSNPH